MGMDWSLREGEWRVNVIIVYTPLILHTSSQAPEFSA